MERTRYIPRLARWHLPGKYGARVERYARHYSQVYEAASEVSGCEVSWFTPCAEPICVPLPVGQVVALGPQRKNDTLPLQVVAPPTVIVAESLTDTEPVPMESPPDGIGLPFPSFAVVAIDEVQPPKVASTKSFSVAVVDVEERVSADTVAKHSLATPPGSSDRLMPPS